MRPAAQATGAASVVLVLLAGSVAWSQTSLAPQAQSSQAQSTQAPATQAQSPQPWPSEQPPPVVQAAPDTSGALAPNRPGFVDEIGKFFSDPPWGLPPLKTPAQTLEDLNARTRDATDNLTRFSKGQVVAGRIKCPVAANGAPDCKVAATKMCTDKGYKEGQSLDSDSAESCPASVILSGKKQDFQECRVENFVIRALCQ